VSLPRSVIKCLSGFKVVPSWPSYDILWQHAYSLAPEFAFCMDLFEYCWPFVANVQVWRRILRF